MDSNQNLDFLIELAKDVYRTLGSGHNEVVYRCAMEVGLREKNIKYESERVIDLKYHGHSIGEGYADLVVHFESETVVVELKAITGKLKEAEKQQLRNYMLTLGINLGLLVNFQLPGSKAGELQSDPLRLPSHDQTQQGTA
jgi:GxxExxY protein